MALVLLHRPVSMRLEGLRDNVVSIFDIMYRARVVSHPIRPRVRAGDISHRQNPICNTKNAYQRVCLDLELCAEREASNHIRKILILGSSDISKDERDQCNRDIPPLTTRTCK